MNKYKIIHQQSKGNRIIYRSKDKGLQWIEKISGNNRWFYPKLNKWGDIDSHNSPVSNTYELNAGSLKAIIRHILKYFPYEVGDVYLIHGKYINTDIRIVIK